MPRRVYSGISRIGMLSLLFTGLKFGQSLFSGSVIEAITFLVPEVLDDFFVSQIWENVKTWEKK